MGWREGGCAITVKAAVSMKNPVCPRGVVSNQVGLVSGSTVFEKHIAQEGRTLKCKKKKGQKAQPGDTLTVT